VISINEEYVGPMLGFLKIVNLKEIRHLYSENGKLAEAAEIINEYLPKGDSVACQRKLIENDLDEYAEF
jgi:hypothetical protein